MINMACSILVYEVALHSRLSKKKRAKQKTIPLGRLPGIEQQHNARRGKKKKRDRNKNHKQTYSHLQT